MNEIRDYQEQVVTLEMTVSTMKTDYKNVDETIKKLRESRN